MRTIEHGCAVVDIIASNTAYRRFAGKITRAGLTPPKVEFRNLLSKASRNMFCVLTTKESVFNSACPIGRMYIIESGKDDTRRVCAVLLGENQPS